MPPLSRLLLALDRLSVPLAVHAHCDLPCGVYDPAQARIEAEAVQACQERYSESDDPVFQQRAVLIKEQLAQRVKDHLYVLWSDYFEPDQFEQYPDLQGLLWQTVKLASDAKQSTDPAQGQDLLDGIDKIAEVFAETKKPAVKATTAAGMARRDPYAGLDR